jgi:hypothetical protein
MITPPARRPAFLFAGSGPTSIGWFRCSPVFEPARNDGSIGWSGREPADAADVEGRPVRGDPTGLPRWPVRAGAARKYQVSRRTVRSALTSAWPAPRKPMPPRPSKLDAFKPVIDDILRADLDAPRKQRHTVKRIYDRLIAEQDMHDVSYAVVRAYAADRKPKIRVEAGRGPVNVFFPQTHRPGPARRGSGGRLR